MGIYNAKTLSKKTLLLTLKYPGEGLLIQSIGLEIACHFGMGQVFNIQISRVFCPNLFLGGTKFLLANVEKND